MALGHLYVFGEMMFRSSHFYDFGFFFDVELHVGCIICRYSLPFCRLSFCFVYGFPCCAKAYKFD